MGRTSPRSSTSDRACWTAETVEAVADVFKLLGDPTRVRLVDALTHGERCVCDLAALVGMTESAVSHQLRLLRAARLVRVRRAGRLAFYSLDDHHVVGLLHDTRKHVEEACEERACERAARASVRPREREADRRGSPKLDAPRAQADVGHSSDQAAAGWAGRYGLIAAGGLTIALGSLASWLGLPAAAIASVRRRDRLAIGTPAQRAWRSVRTRVLDINVLMVIAVAGAAALGDWLEAATVVWLFGVAQWLEARSIDRARTRDPVAHAAGAGRRARPARWPRA